MLIARCEGKYFSWRSDALRCEEELDLLVAKTLDVGGIARHKMLQAFLDLCGANEAAGAPAHDVCDTGFLVDLAHRMAAADRAGCWKFICFC